MNEEEAIASITKMLEKGGTMLAKHHECGAPLFRYKGEIVCPVCSFAGESSGSALQEQAKNFGMEEPGSIQAKADAKSSGAEGILRDALSFKIQELSFELREEKDLSKLKSQLDCIDKALVILRSLPS